MKEIAIKYLENKDIEIPLVWSVFGEFEAPEYSEVRIKEFYKSICDEAYLRWLSMYVAYLDDKLVGVIATRNEKSHVALFFVDGKYHRQGIGRKLLETAKLHCNSDKMTVNSSPYAVPIYAKLRFCQTDKE